MDEGEESREKRESRVKKRVKVSHQDSPLEDLLGRAPHGALVGTISIQVLLLLLSFPRQPLRASIDLQRPVLLSRSAQEMFEGSELKNVWE